MRSYLKNKRPVPDWIVDSFLEKPVQDKTKTNVEKNDSVQRKDLNRKQENLDKMKVESTEYLKPTDYYF